MQYMYAAMLLHSAGKEITDGNVENILNAAGIKPDAVRVKALVAALSEINIEEALKTPIFSAAAPAQAAAAPAEEKKEEEKPKVEEKKEEDLQGLSALFG